MDLKTKRYLIFLGGIMRRGSWITQKIWGMKGRVRPRKEVRKG